MDALLNALSSRLWWYRHFIQKLEMEPRIEFENVHSCFDGLRDNNQFSSFDRWKKGQTDFAG